MPIGIALLLFAVWLLTGLRHLAPGGELAVLDSPLRILAPRAVAPGWHLVPPGLLRLSLYPAAPAAFPFEVGAGDGSRLVSREGIEVVARGTLLWRVDPDRLLEVHGGPGPGLERDLLPRWVGDELRATLAQASYSEVSGARIEELRQTLGGRLTERFRGAGLVLLSCDVSAVNIRSTPGSGAPAAARTPGTRVLVLGLDGADWNLLDPLIAAGKLPHIGRLAREGVRGRLRSITPMLSPVIWTSIATGVLPGRHGIIDFLATAGPQGDRVPVTSTLRKTPAIWNILSDRGVSVGVVGWWATYPAERVDGFIVSDRVAYQLFGAHPARDQVRDGKVHPPDLDPLVQSLTIAPETVGIKDVSRYVRLPADPASLPAEESKLIDDLKTAVAAGDTYVRIALALEERHRPDFMAVYVESTDTVAHLFMRYAPPPLPGVEREQIQRFGRAVDEYYRHADELVGRLLEQAGEGTAVILCSDHGFRTGENRPLTDPRIGYGQAADWHRKYGVVVFHGPPFRRGHELAEASVLDITPTILALFGLPVGEDMDGRPVVEAFTPAFLARHPITYVPSHAIPPVIAEPPGASPRDEAGERELKEKLASLGYLKQDTPNSHNNRGLALLAEEKYDEAIAEFEEAIRASEDLGIARLNIARARFKRKEYDEAAAMVEAYLSREPRSKDAENLLGNIAMEQGRMREAEEHFTRALGYEPAFTDARNSLGILYDRLNRTEEALREFRRVLEVDPDYAEALNNIGLIFKKQGRLREAAVTFEDAIRRDPEFSGSYSNLALVYEQTGDAAAAEEQYRKALERDPRNVTVRTNYGGLLYAAGRLEEARRELERAVAIDPSHAPAHNNLGAVHGRLGRHQDEVAAYRTAVTIDPQYTDARHNLGLALIRQGSWSPGEAELRRVIEIDRRYGPAYATLARSLLQRGRGQEAVELLGAATGEVPRDPDLHALLAEAWLRVGRKDQAIAAFERSLNLKPDQPEVRSRLESIHRGP
ncbi:MAG: tetratricopeptide repeat protein [Candidatus Polarisedimenticolia bacterium]